VQDSSFLQHLPEGECKGMVFEYQKLAAQDVRFDVPLADACMNDRVKFCGKIQPVGGGGVAWLQYSAA
jgi:Golgi apparatus protein 1